MKNLNIKALAGLLYVFIAVSALIFLPAWTLHYWQAWLYLAVFMISISAVFVYLIKNDPELLARRVNNKEETKSQKVIHFFINLAFAVVIVIPSLDHRYGWSAVPWYVVMVGDIFVALGILIIFFVFKENSFTAATIEVAADQRVISTGPYARVRHPMYLGGLIFIVGIPLALGSWWGLLTIVLFAPVMAWRILDEEKFLVKNLPGYAEYEKKVKYRLMPFIW
jgi:protein-S-isoprenylcysteine O-methyltransferase Ste14